MKISYRNQAILKMLDSGILGPVAVNSDDKLKLTDELLEEFSKIWKLHFKKFNENVNILSEPFAIAVSKSSDKLTSGDLLNESFLQNTSGTLIINDRTICYSLKKKTTICLNLFIFYFKKIRQKYLN